MDNTYFSKITQKNLIIAKYLVVIIILISSCHIQSNKNIPRNNSAKSILTTVEESFIDSINIGKKSLNKIELKRYRIVDSNYVIIKFYSKQSDRWNLRNEFNFSKDEVAECDTKISDFNHDGFNDITYVSDIAARGANEIRRLFIYDPINDKLIYIKNSEQYPNIEYNKGLNCIDAFLVYGGCSTVFLKIKKDSLKPFANVELYHGLTVSVYDKHGKERVIRRDRKNKQESIRYKNYSPLEESDEN